MKDNAFQFLLIISLKLGVGLRKGGFGNQIHSIVLHLSSILLKMITWQVYCNIVCHVIILTLDGNLVKGSVALSTSQNTFDVFWGKTASFSLYLIIRVWGYEFLSIISYRHCWAKSFIHKNEKIVDTPYHYLGKLYQLVLLWGIFSHEAHIQGVIPL